MFKKALAVFLSTGMIMTALAGYTSCMAGESTSGTTVYGEVIAISDSTITLALGTQSTPVGTGTPPTGTAPESTGTPPSGTAPSAPSMTDSSSSSGTSTSSASGTADSSATTPSTPPSGDSGGKKMSLTPTGETQTITVTDSTVITSGGMGQSTSASLSDITAGCIISVTIADDTVTAITIMPEMEMQGVTAAVSSANVTVNGSEQGFQAYNINGNTYFKLRDLAKALDGTDKQFEVGYDSTSNAITLTSAKSYTAVGGELEGADNSESATANVSTASVSLDGTGVSLAAYNIGGNNYFKLRDVAAAIDFGVTYDSSTGTINIDTTTGYSA